MTTATKPLLIGMNNPQGNRPLWPDPRGCTGWRIWNMLVSYDPTITKRKYLRQFDRMNLLDSVDWSAVNAAAMRGETLRKMEHRTTVLLGLQVAHALCLPRLDWMKWTGPSDDETTRYCIVPHPSGLNRWYNDPENWARVSSFLGALYDASLPSARTGTLGAAVRK